MSATYHDSGANEDRFYEKSQCSAGAPDPDPWVPLTLAASHIASNSGPENLVKNNSNNLITKSFAFLGGIFGKKSAAAEVPAKVEIVNCDDYYKSDSVTFENVSVKTSSVTAGDTVNFKIKVKNTNNYPIADGSVYIKIYRLKNDAQPSESNYLTEAIKAVNGVNLWAGEEKELEFNWKIPQNLLGGKYETAFFFIGSDQYNLNGLSFTPTVFGASLNLNVIGAEKGFWFGSNNIKINGNLINASTATPILKDGTRVLVSLPLESTLGKGSVNISVDLYDFDFLNEKSKIGKEHQEITVPLTPAKQDLQFIFENLGPGTYAAEISASGESQKSIAEARFSIPGDKGRFVFTGISGFPIQKGQDNAIFSCFSTAVDLYSSFPAKAQIELQEKDTGKVIAGINFNAVINSNKLGVKKVFKAPANSENLVLVSKLFDKAGKLMNEVRTDYNLTDFSQTATTNRWLIAKIIVLVVALLIFLAVLIVLFKKIISTRKNIFKPKNLVLLLIVLGAWASLMMSVQGLDFQGLFQCIGGDQPCCQTLYSQWGQSAPLIQIQKNITGLLAEHNTWKESTLTNLSTNAGSPTNVSNSGSIILDDAPPPTGDFEYGQGWIGTPPINWLENTGIDGTPGKYSANNPPRLCADPANTPVVGQSYCPPGGDQNFIGDKSAFNFWCNNTNKPRYNDANFNLLTDTMWFSGANFPESYLYGNEACIGVSVNCDRTEHIHVTGPLECTLTNPNTGTECTTAWSDCDLKGVHITSECKSTGVGLASITTSHSFSCFAYMDKGVFVQTQAGKKYFWATGQAGNTDFECAPQGQKCWCEGWGKETQIVNQQCAQLAQPLKLISTDPTGVTQSAFSKTYYVDIVDSQSSLTGYTPEGGSLVSTTGPIVLDRSDFTSAKTITYAFKYNNMFPGLEGTPNIIGVNCGDKNNNKTIDDSDIGTFRGGSCDNPGGNNEGTCTIQCEYDNPPADDYNVYLKIGNTEKFAETTIPLQFVGGNNPPTAINFISEPKSCFETLARELFTWTFSDPGDTQTAFQLQASTSANFSSIDYDSGKVFATVASGDAYSFLGGGSGGSFEWGTNYYWRLKVWDSSDLPSVWYQDSSQYFNSGERWPWPEFEYKINTGAINLCANPGCSVAANPQDTVSAYNKSTDNYPLYCPAGICSYNYVVKKGADEMVSGYANPFSYIFDSTGLYNLSLTATDTRAPAHQCTVTLDINVGVKSPKWHEIPPFSMLEEAFAEVSNFLNF